jgi:hypothetical protein
MDVIGEYMREINFKLLTKWNSELSWWFGLVLGDGNVFKTKRNARVTFVCNENTTTKWKNLICPTAGEQIKENCVSVYVDSIELVDWFIAKNIVGEKSSRLVWPEYVPESMYSHFIRGLIDTDGTIYIERRKPKHGNDALCIGFYAQNHDFAERLHTEIIKATGVPPTKLIRQKKTADGKEYIGWSFKHSGAYALQICDWLYKDAPEHLRGESRYQTYIDYKASIPAGFCSCGGNLWAEGMCRTCWWTKRATENPKSPCSKNCGRLEYSKGMCLRCYKKEKRIDNPKYGSNKTGTCICGVTAVLRKNMCTACYMRNRRAEVKKLKSRGNILQ